jgi:hypothetical protein
MMEKDDRLDAALFQALSQLDPPPATPRDEIWARIQASRTARGNSNGDSPASARRDRPTGEVVPLRPRRRTWLHWGAPLAAMLALGIGLGRVSLREAGPTAAPATTASVTEAGDDAAAVPTAYRLAASQHLQRTEALFASLAVDSRTRSAAEVSDWARELLTDTRLLLASPAAGDPAMGRLLEDLELVLSQIAAIPSARAREEMELIQDGINQSDVLLRLRAATTGPRLVGT